MWHACESKSLLPQMRYKRIVGQQNGQAKHVPGHSPSDDNSGSNSSRGRRTERSGSCGSTSSGTASWMYSEALEAPVRYASRSCAAVASATGSALEGTAPLFRPARSKCKALAMVGFQHTAVC